MTTVTSGSSTWRYEEDKLKELLLYVAQRLFGTSKNGSIKLNKILFFSDAYAYAITGKPITGVTYIRRRFGPAPQGIVDIQNKLSMAGDAEIVELHGLGRTQKIVIPKRDPNLALFTAPEIKMVDAVIDALTDMDTDFVSEMSHTLEGWRSAQEGEPIPYFTIFLDNSPLNLRDLEVGKVIAEQLKDDLDKFATARA
jgi:hypothetical protein